MKDCYLGVDIGSISTKGVIIDDNNNIVCEEYLWTEASPVEAVRKLIKILKKKLPPEYLVKGIAA